MTSLDDDLIRLFLANEARRAVATAPSLDEAVGRLAPRVGGQPTGASQRLIVLLAATLLLVLALGTAIAVGSGILRPPLVIDEPTLAGGMWPQSNLEEVRHAQELADAGDPRYAWQVDSDLRSGFSQPSDDTEIVARFLREELGWEEFRFNPIPEDGFGLGASYNNAYIRCAAGRTNPLYPSDPKGSECAPTVDEVRYERVSLDLGQLGRQDDTGIWVVTRWGMLPPFEQVVPPSEAETTTLLEAFLQARIEGEGAEKYVDVPDDESPIGEVPLLNATTTGAPYERSEFELVSGPEWPNGLMQFKVRMFAEGGATVVEQRFLIYRDESGRLRLRYLFNPGTAPTTENGQVVPVQYSFMDGAVTFQAAYPWDYHPPSVTGLSATTTFYIDNNLNAGIAVVADPRPVETGCQQGPAPADAEALSLSIRSDPDLEATAPVAVSLGGIDALWLDVVPAPGGSVCDEMGEVPLVLRERGLASDERMRLYLIDLPGRPARTLAIAIITSEPSFERLLDAAAVVDSFEFDAP